MEYKYCHDDNFGDFASGGYMLTVLGFLNSKSIKTIIHSDVSDEAIDLANRNLSLLTLEGLKDSIREKH